MTTLSEYQKNVLSELGITQWVLRENAESAHEQTQSQPVESVTASNQKTVSSQEVALAKLALLKQQEQPAQAENQQQDDVQTKPASDNPVVESVQPDPVVIKLNHNHPLVQDLVTYLCLAGNIDDRTQLSLKWVEGDSVSLDGDTLSTPSLTKLTQSTDCKKQLWQVLQTWTA
ncbi:hypothetical protein [Neptunicella marina]|uniref:Uncharacterized protein n=1 Tax=Neptunicella marina TaxID=2125989 RepID=A0A8J6IN30_9ALTE|nr:hypothetical protein [Neptunicella marina]MBC3765100.1 hypothetical protein [Neptunicella marina]